MFSLQDWEAIRGGIAMYKLIDEKGSILVIAVFILLLLTMIGIYATNTSTLELMISGNDKVSKRNLYKAESSAYVGASTIDAFAYKPNTNTYGWFHPKSSPADPTDSNTWNDSNSQSIPALGNARFVVNDGGKYIPKDASLVIKPTYGSSQINVFHISGKYVENGGESIVSIGLKKRYY